MLWGRKDNEVHRLTEKAVEPNGWAATAMLFDGPRRATLAALTHLRSRGRVTMLGSKIVLEQPSIENRYQATGGDDAGIESKYAPLAPQKDDPSHIDQQYLKQIVEALSAQPKGLTFTQLLSHTRHAANRLSVHLEDLGLIESPGQRLAKQTMSALPLVLVTLLGLGKIFVGFEREKPVLFLVIMVGASVVFTFLLVKNYPRRTPAGNRMTDDYRKRFKDLDAWMREPEATEIRKPDGKAMASQAGAVPDSGAYLSPQPDLAFFAAIHGMTMMNSMTLGVEDTFYRSLGRQVQGPTGGSDGGDVTSTSSGCGSDGGGGGCGSGCGGCGGD
jgi:uncharacterized protein (TIGR04222 family)